MKTFQLTKEEAANLSGAIEHAPARGYLVLDVRHALKIMDAVKASEQNDGVVVLEDDQHQWLVERLKDQQWLKATPVILSLMDKVNVALTPEAT